MVVGLLFLKKLNFVNELLGSIIVVMISGWQSAGCALLCGVCFHKSNLKFLNLLFSILGSLKYLNFFLHISVNVRTRMTKNGSQFCEACWMLADCNT